MKVLRSIKIVWRALREPERAAAVVDQAKFWCAQAAAARADFDAACEAEDLDAAEAAEARMILAAERFTKETEALLK